MFQLAAHRSITLETTLVRGDIERIEFEIVDRRGEAVARSDALALHSGRARWSWTPNGEHGHALPDELDELIVEARVSARYSGRVRHESLGRIRVYRDRVRLRVVDSSGAALAGVRVRPVLDDGARHFAFVGTDAAGEVELAGLPAWLELGVRVASPWALVDPRRPWTTGKQRGRVRELVVEPKRYDAGLLELRSDPTGPWWPVSTGDQTRRQTVNCEGFVGGEDVPAAAEDPSHFGHTLELRVGARARGRELVGERIYVQLRADSGNADPVNADLGDPRPSLRGADEHGVLELVLDERGALCRLELGRNAGDRFTLEISDTGKFGDAADQRIELVNRHRYYYELAYPAAMIGALASTSDRGHDLPAEVRTKIEQQLDPDGIDLHLARAHVIPDATARACGRLVDATFFARGEARPLFIGSRSSPVLARGFARAGKSRTLFVELLDLAFAPTATQVSQIVELRTRELELGPCEPERRFVPDPRGLGAPLPGPATWIAGDRTGALEPDALAVLDATRARLTLPDDIPTPARVQLTLVELTPAEPSGEQLVFERDPERLAARMCERVRELIERSRPS